MLLGMQRFSSRLAPRFKTVVIKPAQVLLTITRSSIDAHEIMVEVDAHGEACRIPLHASLRLSDVIALHIFELPTQIASGI